jgi:hypothetical protein
MFGPTASGSGSADADENGTSTPTADGRVGRVAVLEAELAGLRRALHNRAVIEQAMGILAVMRRCTPEDAFPLLVRLSQVSNVKLHRIAQLLVQLTNSTDAVTLEAALAAALRQAEPQTPQAPQQPQRDDELVDVARHVVSAAEDPSGEGLDQAVRALHQLLVNRGWIAPYDVLAVMPTATDGDPGKRNAGGN